MYWVFILFIYLYTAVCCMYTYVEIVSMWILLYYSENMVVDLYVENNW